MTGKPFLSVVMPVHDGATWIGRTLESLVGEAEGVEIIVIDSSPGDDTAAIAGQFSKRLPMQFVRRADMGPWQSKTNLSMEMAAADHACILHQDDLWIAGRAATVRKWIADWPAAALHLGPTRIIDRHDKTVGQWTCPLPAESEIAPGLLFERLLVQNFISVPAPVFRRSAWLASGGMDKQLWYTPDWDIWLKLAGQGPVVYHREVTTDFRVHGSSLTVTGSRNADEFRRQMEIVLERHLGKVPAGRRAATERAARSSININVALAAASGGSVTGLASALKDIIALGPAGMARYLRDSRLWERVTCRLRAKLAGAF